MFSKSILEINEKKPELIKIDNDIIKMIVQDAGIKTPIQTIGEPVTWVMQLYRIQLAGGKNLILKIGVIKDWSDESSIKNQIKITKILQSIGIDQPNILFSSIDNNKYGFHFILSERHKGNKLYERLEVSTEKEKEEIYFKIGHTYSMIHEIKNSWAGLWGGDPGIQKYPIHPVDFYKNAEIANGSGKYLLETGIISTEIYDNINRLWNSNFNYLKERPNTLIHNSPFPWSIYISNNHNYSICGLSALGDFMWWDNMVDITHILYPPFLPLSTEMKNSFRSGYIYQIDEKAVCLYSLLTLTCNLAGCYFAPVNLVDKEKWKALQIAKIEHNIKQLYE